MSEKYLRFYLSEQKKKTNVYGVSSKDKFMGTVEWHGPWRRYCFYPMINTLYDSGCLQEITDFLDKVNKEHNDARKPVKENDPHHGCVRTLSIAEMEKLKEDAIIEARRLFFDVKGDDDE